VRWKRRQKKQFSNDDKTQHRNTKIMIYFRRLSVCFENNQKTDEEGCGVTRAYYVQNPLKEKPTLRSGRYLHNTQPRQETHIHALSGIRTGDPSNQAVSDLRLRQNGYQDRRPFYNYPKSVSSINTNYGPVFLPFSPLPIYFFLGSLLVAY